MSAGLPPMIRVDGDVRRINIPALEHKQVHSLIYDIMSDKQRRDYEEFYETDFSFEIPGLARFRVNAFNQNRGAGAVFRTIPSEVLTLEDLGCPRIFKELIEQPQGLILVTGPTGSGKSTTLAAMVDHINKNEYGHMLTIEDPIEFVHTSQKCLVNQREVHRDTHGFNEALRSALREDPDFILVGELRDLETIRLALTAAETGHLVFGTLHTSSAAKTIDRIIDVFPAGEKPMVRSMLSESLRAVISQSLLKKVGGGRMAAHEIMVGIPAIRNLIREDKVAQMYSSIQTGQQFGMQTLDQCLQDLVKRGLVDAPGGVELRQEQGQLQVSTGSGQPAAGATVCRLARSAPRRCPDRPVFVSRRRPAMSGFRFHLVPEADGAQEGLGPVHHGRRGAVDEGAGSHRADHPEPAQRAAVARHGAQRDDARAARGVREDPRVPVRHLRAGRGPLPRVVLLPAQLRRHGAAPDRVEDPDRRKS